MKRVDISTPTIPTKSVDTEDVVSEGSTPELRKDKIKSLILVKNQVQDKVDEVSTTTLQNLMVPDDLGNVEKEGENEGVKGSCDENKSDASRGGSLFEALSFQVGWDNGKKATNKIRHLKATAKDRKLLCAVDRGKCEEVNDKKTKRKERMDIDDANMIGQDDSLKRLKAGDDIHDMMVSNEVAVVGEVKPREQQ